MATFSSLAPELLSHILNLSNEGEDAKTRQRACFAFGLIARAFYLATADTTEFYVAGESQAEVLVEKLEKEKELAARAERDTASGGARPRRTTNIRRLSLVIDDDVGIFANLLLMTPDLVALELDVVRVTAVELVQPPPSLSRLEAAMVGMLGLREVRHCSGSLSIRHLLNILTHLKELRHLDLEFEICYRPDDHDDSSFFEIPNLHTLRTSIYGDTNELIDSFLIHLLGTKSSPGIRELDLKETPFDLFSSDSLLAKIHNHSTEGESAGEQQRSRFSFGRVSRACYLATADATEFYVAGGRQAKALLLKLVRERRVQEEREREAATGKTNPWKKPWISTRVNHVRRLAISITSNMESFNNLIRALPDLYALELELCPASNTTSASLASLEMALGSLASLQELQFRTDRLDRSMFLRILNPLKELRVLDLQFGAYLATRIDYKLLIESLSLPNIRTLRIRLDGESHAFMTALLNALATRSTNGIHTLDLTSTDASSISPKSIKPLLPHFSNITHLTWAPPRYRQILGQNQDARDATLEMIGSMKSLQYLSMTLWTLWVDVVDDEDNEGVSFDTVDSKVFDTLATLSSLHTVKLLTTNGVLDESYIISLIEAY
ncbi:hypothetical protein RQP46_010756 [Phenoliferia psychrophenolica]